ncbi:ATP-dependent zinc metalloprotease FtsH [Phaeovibrio sulfidiphilus]|uniref:ATP-dependent zinc metalloprotease FtsH n=1 Tax=Phaeovibrio sulfidiphilus TaxID=1220600 RepID=A0A8J6YLR7_9PROT|nr:ATP-dependent zinc metalloprotease FtsH [Phaeovibrio sulfidiphilus]MBE1236114.1 ATP-dependent zinc metalloprotease FtsH [Phaeovibrio sulfidiphilus]
MNISRNILLYLVLFVLLVVLVNLFQAPSGQSQIRTLPYSEFVSRLGTDGSDKIKTVEQQGQEVVGTLTSGERYKTTVPVTDLTLSKAIVDSGATYTVKPAEPNEITFWGVVLNILPFALLIGVWFLLMRQMQGGGGKAMGFGKSRARLLTEKTGRVTFDDVAGIDESKQELEEVVEFLRDPQKFQRLGGKIPKGVLLVGPPGTGKTLLARAIAGEANVPFFTISGSDFVEMFVGVGASRVRDMFEQGKKNAPCLIFIDEIDAVGRHRGAGLGGGNDEREQTLNQLLVEMDGFEANEGVILIAATNRPDVLDPALLRPGRFDRQVVVPNPDIIGREKILRVHMRKTPLAPDVDAKVIARGTPGFSGADLANLVNEAALMAARLGKRVVTMSDFEAAKDKVMMGAERRSMVMTEDEKEKTAYHEAGHALVALKMEGHDPLHKVTIIPRGRALGVTMSLPERDRYGYSLKELKARIAMAFGGRVAEELVYGPDEVTTGASNDIKQATEMARRMVTEFGFSEKLGPLRYTDNQEEVFLGHSVAQQKNVSDKTAALIDEEVRRFVEEGEKKAREILSANRDALETITRGLLEYETLSGDEVIHLMNGETLDRKERPAPPPPRSGGRRSTIPSSGPGDFTPTPTSPITEA